MVARQIEIFKKKIFFHTLDLLENFVQRSMKQREKFECKERNVE